MATIFQKTVGTSAVQLSAASIPNRRVILLQPLTGNTGAVYRGYANTVTTTGGYELPAGVERVVTPAQADDATGVWLIADAANQVVCVEVV